MISTETGKIERTIVVRAPQARVWRALTNLEEFAKWFSVEAEGKFEPGARLRMVSTYDGSCKGESFVLEVEEMTPESVFSWRWHPGTNEPGVDYSKEPKTLVRFELEPVDGGTRVTVVESGFDGLSLARRARIFAENVEGWKIQLAALAKYAGEAA